MTPALAPPSPPAESALDPALLRFIEALARADAAADYDTAEAESRGADA